MTQYTSLNLLDYIVFFIILLITFLAAAYAYRRQKNPSGELNVLDYILMGRTLTLPLFVATLVATWYGGILGVTRIAYESGIYNFVTQGAFWYITYIAMAFFFVKKIRAYNVVTLPELVEKLFGPKAARVAAIFNFINVIPIAYTISFGIFLQAMFGGNLYVYTLLGTVIAIIYSAISGFRSVVYSEVIQFIVMVSSVAIVLFASIFTFGGWDYLTANLPESFFSATGGHGWGATLVWGFIALSTLVDPNFYQRILAAKDAKVAKNGILISTVIWCFFDICTTFGAMYARAHMPGLDPNQAYMMYAIDLLPHGLRGFFLAGVLATILSTLDSYLFVASNTIAYDLIPKIRNKRIMHILSLIAVGAMSFGLSFFFEGNIRVAWKVMGSYFAGSLLLPICYSLYYPGRIREKQFLFLLFLSVTMITLWQVWDRQGFWAEVDSLYVAMLSQILVGAWFVLKAKK
jgi:SSS family solute:Na+ symporter